MPVAFRWRRAARALFVAGGVFAVACGVDEYKFVPDDPVDAGIDQDSGPPPPATPTVCGTDADCAALLATTVCDTRTGYCVECLPEREEELDRCAEGTYCQADNRCGLGCASDLDCRGLTCDVPTHTCTGCTSTLDCSPGAVCDASRCVPGCAGDETCPSGWPCCAGLCKNLNSDAASCGACDAACDVTGQCINGVCGPGPCETGLGECNGNAADGCETDLISNPSSCGRCRAVCASGMCSGGMCTGAECPDGYADCNQLESDLCETSLSTVTNCLMCGKACSAENGEPSCTRRGCAIACDEGYGDCDEDADTGCETGLSGDLENCGACGTVCENENGSTRCVDGECRPTCGEGFADCDGDPENGCETDLETSLDHCGACGAHCAPENATGACVLGVCEPTCEEGFFDCNGSAGDGCEADLFSPETCGGCSTRCSDNGGRAVCNDEQACEIVCNTGRADCINGVLDGCETNTNVSTVHCGMCGRICPSAVGVPACYDGVCGVSTCTDPNRECDGDGATTCETDVTDDAENCGACGTECFYQNASGVCINRACSLSQCATGWANCINGAADGCETRLGTEAACRSCGETCSNEHGENPCTAEGCRPVCQTSHGDCDSNRNNGCETPLNTLQNCGACARVCSIAHGTPKCDARTCEIATCDPGWDDCDDNPANGCETPLNTNANCAACGVGCNIAHASESCATGTCTFIACDTGFQDCTAQAGCETPLGTETDCRSCGDACNDIHGVSTCASATLGCQQTSCDAGWRNCDGSHLNGCERNIWQLSNCGECDRVCARDHAAESCGMGTCTLGLCESGWGNCDGDPANGCETPLNTAQNCRACGTACSNAHGPSSCGPSGCVSSCPDPAWGACDSNPNNGCETSLRSLTDCATCGTSCNIPNSEESCSSGMCAATTCSTGFANCETSNPNCETTLFNNTNCRFCGESCTNPFGTTSCNQTSGCVPSCSADGANCDGNPANGCERDIRTVTDCGSCNNACSFPNAAASCHPVQKTCQMGACATGFRDCTAAAGCETPVGPQNCNACGHQCQNANGPTSCVPGPGSSYVCNPACVGLFGDCNTSRDDGCEQPLTSTLHCGACGVPCAFPNAAASCLTGTCQMGPCNTNFRDCSTTAPGCETQIGTSQNCDGCGNTCTNAHGTTSCVSVTGGFNCAPVCHNNATNGYYANCNGEPDDGCETQIDTVTNCGGCGTTCSFPNAAESCPNKVCTMGACDPGFGNCDGIAANGCETVLGTNDNCNACGNRCANSNGSIPQCTPQAAPGTFDCVIGPTTCNANWASCNGNPDDGCETDLTQTMNCGQCGRVCGTAAPFCVSGPTGYNCAAQLAISYVNDVEHTTGSVMSSFTHNLATSIGQARLVLLALTMNGNSSGSVPEVVQYAGTNMTFYPMPPAAPFGNNQAFTAIYYLVDTSLGGAGAKTVTLDATGGQNNPTQMRANLLEFRGVHQTQPINVVVNANNGNCGSGQNPIHAITTVTAGSFLVDVAAAFTGSTITFTPSGGLTNTMAFVTAPPLAALAGYRGPLTVGTYTVGWTLGACNNSAHTIVALRPGTSP